MLEKTNNNGVTFKVFGVLIYMLGHRCNTKSLDCLEFMYLLKEISRRLRNTLMDEACDPH